MSNDLLFVSGLMFLILALPSFVGAFSESRAPRAAIIFVALGGGLIFYTTQQQPNVYTLDQIPEIVGRVFDQLFR